MSFFSSDENYVARKQRAVIDCTGDKMLTEQSHKREVDINEIVRKHGADMIAKTARLASAEFRFDDVTGNDFQEASLKILKAKESFESLPSKIRKEFDNNPAIFLDFVHNPDNLDRMIELGLAKRVEPPAPVQVQVVNPDPVPETPSA